jgi:tetratricopeptide (TPR) repeat protein
MELDNSIYNRILQLCEDGNNKLQAGNILEAIRFYEDALDLVPEPKENWDAGKWIFTAIGDANFHLKEFQTAINWLFQAYNCPEGFSNAFILLRIGQCFFELNNLDKAADFLGRAFLLHGQVLFQEDHVK